ncbi:MAG: CBS domain-containing protein [Spirochaetia bacterium]|nr:CBS domain-containing protein [Spirochaetia bacterium]
MSILVRDVMVRDVASVSIPGSRDDVLKTLQDHKVSGVPVIKKGEVVGMITRTDLLRNRDEDQTALLMSRDPVVISPDKSIVEASRLLIKHDIRRLPVVEGKKLVGIITVADIVRVAEDLGIKESIEPYLEKETVVLWSEMPLAVAGSIMEFAAVEACPVIDTSLKLVGMISDRDLIKTSVIEDTVEVVLQVNGKVRSKIKVSALIGREELKEAALNDEKLKSWLQGKPPRNVVVVPGKLVNVVL